MRLYVYVCVCLYFFWLSEQNRPIPLEVYTLINTRTTSAKSASDKSDKDTKLRTLPK